MDQNSMHTARIYQYQISEDQYEMYKNYASYNFQPQSGYYSSIPAYQQLNHSQVPSALYSPTTSSESGDHSEKIFFSIETSQNFKLNCEHCGSSYTSRKRLQNHYEKCNVLNAGSENVIVCKICKKTFKTNSGYTNHVMRFHGDVESSKQQQEIQEVRNVEEVKEERPRSIFHSIDMLAKSDA